MFNWRNFSEKLESDRDYTVGELVAMGISQHAIYNAIKRGIFQKRRIFGKTYINGSIIKEYILNGTDKV